MFPLTSRIKASSLFLVIVLAIGASSVHAQQTATLKGRVVNTKRQGIADVNLGLQGTGMGAASDKHGHFIIQNVPAGSYIFMATAVGFKTVRKSITVNDGQTLKLTIHLSKDRQQLEQIIVNGRNEKNSYAVEKSRFVAKIPLNRMENPQVYSSIPQGLLADQMDYSLTSALKNATGLQKMWGATGRSGDGGAYYNSRGFILQSKLRNGVAGNITSRIDAINIKKVEVVKGPSAALFGNALTSYGGLINRVTKKPYSSFGGQVNFSAGNYGFRRLSADVNTPIDSDQKVLLRINAAYNYKNSFQDNAFSRYFVFDPSLTYKVNNRLTFSFDAELYRGRNLNTSMIFFSPSTSVSDLGTNRADGLPINYRRTFASRNLAQDSRNSNYFGKLSYKISNHWNTTTNATVTHSFSNGPSPFLYLLSNNDMTGNPGDIGADYVSRNDQSTRSSTDDMIELQQNLNGTFTLGSFKNRFVAGLDYFHHHSDVLFADVTFDSVASHGTIPDYRSFNKRNLKTVYTKRGASFIFPEKYIKNTYSAYASDVLNLTDNLMVMAALRFDYFVNDGSYNASSGRTSGGYHQTALSPKFGIVYQLFDGRVSLFGNEQNGFTNQSGTNFKGQAFTPEHANQWEGGVKLNLLDGRLSGTFSYYDIVVKDKVRPDPDHPNFSIQNGTQYSKGVEVDFTTNPVQGLNATAGFAYNDSKYGKSNPDIEGLRPITAMSPSRAHWWISYRFPATLLQGIGVGFGGNYFSDNKIVNSRSRGVFILPAYAAFYASAFYNCSQFRFSLKVGNLTNKRYWTGYTTINPQELRSIAASISFKF